MILGTQLAFAASALRELTGLFAGRKSTTSHRMVVKFTMQVVVSVCVLAWATYTLRHPTSADQEKAVWGAVGIVIGYWLR